MRISKRTRYGLRLMIELALTYGKDSVSLSKVAQKEEISKKYLSQIIIPLKGTGFIRSTRGIYGGYILTKAPSKISLEEIVKVLEGDISLVECLHDTSSCSRANICVTREVWNELSDIINTKIKIYLLGRSC